MHTRDSERGVILVIVGLILASMIFLSAFVVDMGAMWYARTQAQTAADAGALAGAIARMHDEPATAGPITVAAATRVAQANTIMDAAGGVVVDTAASACPSHAPSSFGPCVKVEVYRDGTNTSAPLPTFFAQGFGVSSQNTRAMAVAQVRAANFSSCIKPWMIPDRFIDVNGNRRYDVGDTYIPPTDPNTTGYTRANSLGASVVLKPGQPNGAVQPGNFFEVETAQDYEESITGCYISKAIGDTMNILPGSRVGPTKQGTNDLVALDPDAEIDPQTGIISGSCAPVCAPISPRLVPIAVYAPTEYAALGFPQGSNFALTIVNILGFFIQDVTPQGDVVGIFADRAGESRGTGLPSGASFLRTVMLVQ